MNKTLSLAELSLLDYFRSDDEWEELRRAWALEEFGEEVENNANNP